MTHPWFGDRRLTPVASAERIRETLRTEVRDTGWPYQRLLPAVPLALPRSSYAELFRASNILLDLLRRTVMEVASTTRGRMDVFGVTDRDYPLFVDDPVVEERYAHCMARPDIAIGPSGPRFMEFNVSGGFGGVVETRCRYTAWRKLYEQPGGGLPYAFHDPFAGRAALFTDICEELALPPRLAWVGSVRDHMQKTDSTRYFDLETDYLNAHGFSARFFEPEDLEQAWHTSPERRYHLGLRHLTVPDWEDAGISIEPVRQALDNGCLLLSTQTSSFISNKQTMGLLSEGRPWMSVAERALVDRYLPWTRILTDRAATWHGERVDLLSHAVRERERLVLKRGIGSNGRQVVLGRDTGPGEWQTLVEDAAAAGDSVVQEYVPTQPYPLYVVDDDDDEPREVEVLPVFSPFVFGGRPSGVLARYYAPGADGATGIVNVTGRFASDDSVVVL